MSSKSLIVVAGHICIDLIPEITASADSFGALLKPGKLLNVGPAVASTGGAVANTGLALHKLGLPVRLTGKVGDDAFGGVIVEQLRRHGGALADAMKIDAASNTSYTMVLSPPGLDRVFLHHPGANDTFGPEDIAPRRLEGAALFHFGYPPLMRRLFSDGGRGMTEILKAARGAGALTSLDMAMPDPQSASGRVDWRTWLAAVLPHVDVFLPSYEELAYVLGEPGAPLTLEALRRFAEQVLELGAAAVAIKLGENGLYLRTARGLAWKHFDSEALAAWQGRELLTTCCKAKLVGTTGAGDCTIAGFLVGLFEKQRPEETLAFATAVGACSVEQRDATSGVPTAERVRARLAAGWQRHGVAPELGAWKPSTTPGVFAPEEEQESKEEMTR